MKRIVFGSKASSELYVAHLRSVGMKVGEGTKIYNPRNTIIDEQYPWLISIGNNVRITDGCRILSHGFDWSVAKTFYGHVLGVANRIIIGNNVFIGMNTIVLGNVTIGDNVIIGAGTIVNKDIPNNCVAVGNPVKVISSLDEYYKKKVEIQNEQCVRLARAYYEIENETPPESLFHEFFFLFAERDVNEMDANFVRKLEVGNNYDESLRLYKEIQPIYNGYKDFIEKVIGNEVDIQ